MKSLLSNGMNLSLTNLRFVHNLCCRARDKHARGDERRSVREKEETTKYFCVIISLLKLFVILTLLKIMSVDTF